MFHQPVMVLQFLSKIVVKNGHSPLIVDGCAGLGGHSIEILKSIPNTRLLCIDRDPSVGPTLQQRVSDYESQVTILTDTYANTKTNLQEYFGSEKANGTLLDLGYNSIHVDNANRGFSFQKDGPLDMRYDQSTGITAADLINQLDRNNLVSIFYEYSGESLRTCKHITNIICERRQKSQFNSTLDLANCMNRALSTTKRSTKTPCTGLFQALRIAVNREFDHLDLFMEQLPDVLDSGGISVFLCFQSLEVKRIKMWMKKLLSANSEKQFTILTPKPILPSKEEIAANVRSRSAVLYAIQRNSYIY